MLDGNKTVVLRIVSNYRPDINGPLEVNLQPYVEDAKGKRQLFPESGRKKLEYELYFKTFEWDENSNILNVR